MSRIPNSAIPHAWAEDSDHAKDVRHERTAGESREAGQMLKIAAISGLALIALRLVSRRLASA